MAEPGWYPDPQDPAAEAYFDGTAWTGARRPLTAPPVWQPPAPEWSTPAAWQPEWQPQPGWPAQSQQQWQPPPPPTRRRRRKPLILAIVAVAVVAAGLLTWQFWPADHEKITYEGKPVTDPDTVLTKAESVLRGYVKDRHGAANGATRCYFSKPKTPAADAKDTDVTTSLVCGPVLFVDGDTAYPYIEMRLTTDLTDPDSVTLRPPYSLNEVTPEAVDADVLLVRPDGKSAPSGAGGLTVPDPPPADADVLTSASLGKVPTPPTLRFARMVGKTTGVILEAAGVVPRYGLGEDARSAPPGQKLIAFQLTYTAGDVSGAASGSAQLVVDGGAPRILPKTVGSDEWDIAAIDKASSAVLQLRNGGYTQTLSLPAGKPGRHNLAVLARRHRLAPGRHSAAIQVRYSNANGSVSDTWHAKLTEAHLEYWDYYYTRVHASDGQHALLTTDLIYTDALRPGKHYGIEPDLLRIVLPGGQVVHARNIANHNRIKNVFNVPASFTHGTLEITGSIVVSGVRVTIEHRVSFRLSFASG